MKSGVPPVALKSDGSPFVEEESAAGVPFDGGAARIPFDMEPGDTAGLMIELTAPDAPGEYVLELDMVQEGVAPSPSRGAKPLRASVKVSPVP